MQDKKLMILIILSVLAVFSLIYGIVTPPKSRYRASRRPEIIRENKQLESAKEGLAAARHAKKSDYAAWGRSPFDKETTKDMFPEFTLKGIVWDEKNPKAIINNDIVEIGDRVGKNTVIGIKKDSVILSDGTNDFELGLWK